MKKSYLLLILASMFFMIRVKAVSNVGMFSNLSIADTGNFSSLNGLNSVEARGYSLIKNSSFYYALPSNPSYTYGTYGGALVQCGLSFVKNSYYSMTYYFILDDGSNYLHPYYTSQKPRMAILDNSNQRYFNFDYETVSTGVEIATLPEVTIFGGYLGYFTVIFKAPNNGTCINMAFSSSSKYATPQEAVFVGYTYESMGSAALSESELKNAMSSALTDVDNKLNGMWTNISSNIDYTKSQNDQIMSKQDETNKKMQETNDFLKDDTDPDVDVSSLATVSGLLPAGPVDSLLNIPFKFLSVISSSVSGTCVPVQTSWVFDSTLTLPCFSDQFYNDVPSALMNFLSLIPSAFILITYFKYLYKKVDRAVSMNSTADDEWGVI